jgi:hypothetical protein
MDRVLWSESTTNGGFREEVLKYWDYYPRIPIDCLK